MASASSSTCTAARAAPSSTSALASLCHLNHRGAAGAEPDTGDGAGILVQMPDAFYRAVLPFELPPVGSYATGIAFVPPETAAKTQDEIEKVLVDEGFTVLGWREIPIDPMVPGTSAREVMPTFRQVFVAKDDLAGDELERHVYMARKRIEHTTDAYFPSLSARVVVYKGMLTPDQLEPFYADLQDERLVSALGPRALALLDQHVPELAARAPVPDARPQRRDQHRAGQRELDARPRGRDESREPAR